MAAACGPMDLDVLMRRWRGPIAGYCAVRGLDPEAADRVAHDVFVAAWLGRARFVGSWDDAATVGRWLRGIARNLLRNALRSARRSRIVTLVDDPASATQPDEVVARRAERAAVHAALAGLGARDREVVWMFYFDATSTLEVASLLGTTPKAVENRLRRARARLRGVLAPWFESEEREVIG